MDKVCWMHHRTLKRSEHAKTSRAWALPTTGNLRQETYNRKPIVLEAKQRSRWSKVKDGKKKDAEWEAFLKGCQHETSQSGACRHEASHSGACQHGTSQSGACQHGTSQSGACQHETSQSGACQHETSQSGACQHGTSQSGACQHETSQSGACVRVYQQQSRCSVHSALVATHLPCICYKAPDRTHSEGQTVDRASLPGRDRAMCRLLKTMSKLGIPRRVRSAPPQRLPYVISGKGRDVHDSFQYVVNMTPSRSAVNVEPVIVTNHRGQIVTLTPTLTSTLNISSKDSLGKSGGGKLSTLKHLDPPNMLHNAGTKEIPTVNFGYGASQAGTGCSCKTLSTAGDDEDNQKPAISDEGEEDKEKKGNLGQARTTDGIKERNNIPCTHNEVRGSFRPTQHLNNFSSDYGVASPQQEQPNDNSFPKPSLNQGRDENRTRFAGPFDSPTKMSGILAQDCINISNHTDPRSRCSHRLDFYKCPDKTHLGKNISEMETVASVYPSGSITTSTPGDSLPHNTVADNSSNIGAHSTTESKDKASIILENKNPLPIPKTISVARELEAHIKSTRLNPVLAHTHVLGESAERSDAAATLNGNKLKHYTKANENNINLKAESKYIKDNSAMRQHRQSQTSLLSSSGNRSLTVGQRIFTSVFRDTMTANDMACRTETCPRHAGLGGNPLRVLRPTALTLGAEEINTNIRPEGGRGRNEPQDEKSAFPICHENGERTPVITDRKVNRFFFENEGENNDLFKTAGRNKNTSSLVDEAPVSSVNKYSSLACNGKNVESPSRQQRSMTRVFSHVKDDSILAKKKNAYHYFENIPTSQNSGGSLKEANAKYKQNIDSRKNPDYKIIKSSKEEVLGKRKNIQLNMKKLSDFDIDIDIDKHVSETNASAKKSKAFKKSSARSANAQRIHECVNRLYRQQHFVNFSERSTFTKSKNFLISNNEKKEEPTADSDVSSAIKTGTEEFEEIEDYQWVAREIEADDVKEGVSMLERKLIKRLVPRQAPAQKESQIPPKANESTIKRVIYRKAPSVAYRPKRSYVGRRYPATRQIVDAFSTRRLSAPYQTIDINFQAEVSATQALLQELKLMPPRRKGKAAISSPRMINDVVARLNCQSKKANDNLDSQQLSHQLTLINGYNGEQEARISSVSDADMEEYALRDLDRINTTPISEPDCNFPPRDPSEVCDVQREIAKNETKDCMTGNNEEVSRGLAIHNIESEDVSFAQGLGTRPSRRSEAECLALPRGYPHQDTRTEKKGRAERNLDLFSAKDPLTALLEELGVEPRGKCSPIDDHTTSVRPASRSEYSSLNEEDVDTGPVLAGGQEKDSNSFGDRIEKSRAMRSDFHLAMI
ncbi:hypothetical protein RRG08_019977 [Elysia crispata]|uniref:Uncharacterized protein n=1 Tax=Elysia crispata TaxID=231223 RepID=A0AAE1ECV4_9GAST|nr:hypothetical protein RRG08_019977 [Elysia crispata]